MELAKLPKSPTIKGTKITNQESYSLYLYRLSKPQVQVPLPSLRPWGPQNGMKAHNCELRCNSLLIFHSS